MPAVGHTSRDPAGLSTTNKTELKWPEHQWRTARNPSVLRQAEIWPLLLRLSEEAQQTTRESCHRTKAWKYQLTVSPPPFSLQGDTETLPKQGGLSIARQAPLPEGRLKNQEAHIPKVPIK